jgi:hypothetical protein
VAEIIVADFAAGGEALFRTTCSTCVAAQTGALLGKATAERGLAAVEKEHR